MPISKFMTLARAIDNFKYDQSAENASILKDMMQLSTYLLPAAPKNEIPQEMQDHISVMIQHVPDLGGVLVAYSDKEQAAKAEKTRLMSEVGFNELLRLIKDNRSLIQNIVLNPEGSAIVFGTLQFLDLYDMPATVTGEEKIEAGETLRLSDNLRSLPEGFIAQFKALLNLHPEISKGWILLQKDAGDDLKDRWLLILEAEPENESLALAIARPLAASFQIPLAICYSSDEAAKDVVDVIEPVYSK